MSQKHLADIDATKSAYDVDDRFGPRLDSSTDVDDLDRSYKGLLFLGARTSIADRGVGIV